jgi:hypothetical protein
MADVLKKLGDKMSDTLSALKSIPPDESEQQSLRDKQQQIDAMTLPQPAAPAAPQAQVPEPARAANDPLNKYGARPGEKRFDVDKDGNLTQVPVPQAPVEKAPAQRPVQHPVLAQPENKSPMKPIIPQSLTQPLPSYDGGGDVPEDQVAVVHKDEKVLTPEEAEQYRTEHPEENKTAAPEQVASAAPAPTTSVPDESLKLKPYGKVVEEKANAKAAEQVAKTSAPAEGGAPADGAAPMAPAPKEEKPKVTYGHILADQWLQKNGMPSMESLRTPKEFNQGSPDQGKVEDGMASPKELNAGAPTPQGGLKPIVPPEAPAAAPSGKEAFQQKIATYDKAYQTAMDMAAKTNDPQYTEQAARIKEAKLAYEKEHPWGSKESAHPGILGKLGHVAEVIGQRAPGLAPIVSTLPGSEVYRGVEAQGAREQAKEASTENTAENKKLETAGYKQVTGGAIDPKAADELKGVPQTAFYNEKTGDIIYKGALAPKQSAGEAKAAFQKTLSKIGTAEAADPGQQMDAIKAAHLSGVIDDQEYREAIGYLGSTSNAPATQAATKSESKMQGKLYYYDTPTGRKAMTTAEAKRAGLTPEQGYEVSAGQAEKDREKDSTYHTIQKALTQYQKHIGEGKLTPDDITTMTTITEDAEKPDYISKLIAGGFDDLLGHPVTGYSEKLMKGTLTKNQYQDMSPAARQLVADYYTTMMAHFANMKASQGTIPRNPVIIQTEMHTIPKPFLNAEESGPAFKNYLDQVGMRNSDNVAFDKPKAKEETAPSAPANAQDEVVVNGKVVGHTVAGPDGKKKYVPLQQ